MTLWAIQQTKKELFFGISEGYASDLLDKWFAKAGFGKAGALVLFGRELARCSLARAAPALTLTCTPPADAALPHGASGNRCLKKDDLVLIECVAPPARRPVLILAADRAPSQLYDREQRGRRLPGLHGRHHANVCDQGQQDPRGAPVRPAPRAVRTILLWRC